MVDAELDEDDEIVVDNVLPTVGPATYACASPGLIGVFATGIKLPVAVLDGIDVTI